MRLLDRTLEELTDRSPQVKQVFDELDIDTSRSSQTLRRACKRHGVKVRSVVPRIMRALPAEKICK